MGKVCSQTEWWVPVTYVCQQRIPVHLVLAGQFLEMLIVCCLHDILPIIQSAYFCLLSAALLLQLFQLPAQLTIVNTAVYCQTAGST